MDSGPRLTEVGFPSASPPHSEVRVGLGGWIAGRPSPGSLSASGGEGIHHQAGAAAGDVGDHGSTAM